MNATGLEAPKRLATNLALRFAPDDSAIDFSRYFIAEELTPLFHTSAYSLLPASVQLRYNQLHALYFNEQFTFLEQEMLSPALLALPRGPLPPGLADNVRIFFEEEQLHTAMFRELNRRAAPELYSSDPCHFVRVPRPFRKILRTISAQPRRFPWLIWLALLQEERSLYFSKICLNRAGNLEPHFVAIHRAHLADEIGHVGWDEELLDWLWPRIGPVARRLNAWFLNWAVGEYFYLPKRSAVRVIDQLVSEFPDLEAPILFAALRTLGNDRAYLQTLYSREVTPRAFARFDRHPDFARLARTPPAYRPPRFFL